MSNFFFTNVVNDKITTKGYPYQSYLDVKEGTSFENGLDEAIDNAIDAKAKRIMLVVDSKNKTASIYDDGVGMSDETLFNVASNAAYHEDRNNGSSIGIRGRGIKNIIAACCRVQDDCVCEIYSSTDGETATNVRFTITHDDEDILHPVFKQFFHIKNNKDFTIDDFYDGNFIGTVLYLTNIENVNFGADVIRNYGRKYCNDIRDNNIEITFVIDGQKFVLEAIDPMFFNGKKVNGIEVFDNGGYYLIHEKYTAYNKYDSNDTFDFELESFCAYDIATFKKFLGNDKKKFTDGFNVNGGIYTKRQNRYMNLGGNTSKMFSKNDKLDGSDKEKACGDSVGGNSQYNRICIVIDNDKAANVFKVNSVKSRGIVTLSYNENLREYLVDVNGRTVNVYELIAKTHKFNNRSYKICNNNFKTPEGKYSFIKDWSKEEWKIWDFSAQKPSKQLNSVTEERVEQTKNLIKEYDLMSPTIKRMDILNQGRSDKKYSINDKSVFINLKWCDSFKNETYIINCSVNENSDLYVLLIQNGMSDKISTILENFEDFIQSIIIDHDKEDIKSHLVKYTEVLYKKYTSIYED